MPCLIKTVLDFLSQPHNKLCHFISDVTDSFLAGKPISITARLAINPDLQPEFAPLTCTKSCWGAAGPPLNPHLGMGRGWKAIESVRNLRRCCSARYTVRRHSSSSTSIKLAGSESRLCFGGPDPEVEGRAGWQLPAAHTHAFSVSHVPHQHVRVRVHVPAFDYRSIHFVHLPLCACISACASAGAHTHSKGHMRKYSD